MDNIFTASKPILWLTRGAGLCLMSFEGPASLGVLKLKKRNIFICICNLIILLALASINFINKSFVQNDSAIITEGWNIEVMLHFLSIFFLFGYQIYKRESVARLLHQIHNFDVEVS